MANAIQPALFGEATPATPPKRRKKPSKVRTVTADCKICLEPFTYRKVRRAQAFCSALCRQISFRYDRVVACHRCRICNEWFPSPSASTIYCGSKCQAVVASRKARKVARCKGCRTPFAVRKFEQKLFCTPDCRYAYAHDRACSGCGNTISSNNPRQKWCTDCQGTYRRDQLVRRARQGWDRLDYDLRNAYADLVRRMPCTYCGCSPDDRKMHADHAVPLSRGGSDAWHNLVPACEPCNLRKHSKTPEEFAASRGR